MRRNDRRRFLANVGQGMLAASVGSALAVDLGLAPSAWADEPKRRLTFGALEPLVTLIQSTEADKLLPLTAAKLKNGTELKTLVAATALANARAFGGQNYDGYHAFMALAPAYQMAKEMPKGQEALPFLKVLHRNARFMHEGGCHEHDQMDAVRPSTSLPGPTEIRDACRSMEREKAEAALAAAVRRSPVAAYQLLQAAVHDDIEVHRVVLAWRAWETLDLTGQEHADTLLRQSVRFCVDAEKGRVKNQRPEPGVRTTLPKLLDQHGLIGRKLGGRTADDAWLEQMCQTIYASSREQAAGAAAAALAEGFAPADVAEALSLAANRLVLRDPGRTQGDAQRPVGSVHGASVGVHASDSANAWRHIVKVSDPRNVVASLIVGAYHTAGQAGYAGQPPYPWPEHLENVREKDAAALLGAAEEAIRAKDQVRVSAVVHRFGELGHAPEPVFALLLKYAVSEDGALHAEKYYRTASEEFAAARPAFRWRQLVALARVTASEYGFPAPGYADACRLLKG